jgi:tripartite-type tricarboxylate transporter receptor subunit TctC
MQSLTRRAALALPAALAAPALQAQGSNAAFSYPIRIVVPAPPGGTSDILARLIGPELTKALGQPVVVENRAGANGNIGADNVAKSPPDGHALLLMDVTTLATNPALYPRLSYDVRRDLAPVSMLIYAPYVLAVANKVPVRDPATLQAYARANPGGLNAGNSGVGSSSHIALVTLAEGWGTEMTHVPYRGGAPALLAIATGEADITIQGATQALPYATSGQMRAVAVTGGHRLAALPAVPTFHELGWTPAGAGTWQGLLAQGNTPRPVVERVSNELRAILDQPAIAARLTELGGEPRTEGPDAFRRWLDAETASFTEVIRRNNIRAE